MNYDDFLVNKTVVKYIVCLKYQATLRRYIDYYDETDAKEELEEYRRLYPKLKFVLVKETCTTNEEFLED